MESNIVGRRVILDLTEAEGLLSTNARAEDSATPTQSVDDRDNSCVSDRTGAAFELVSNEAWEVYYDTEDYKLTLRGWWLRERNDCWVLRLPAFELGKPSLSYEEVSHPEDILERVGLTQQAKAFSSGICSSMEQLLKQVRVLPFARFRRTAHAKLCLSVSPHPSEATPREALEGTLDKIFFDVKYAENEAVSELLFTCGSDAIKAREAVVANFWITREEGSNGSCQESHEQLLFSVLRARGLERFEPPRQLCPRLLAYLWTFRPKHLRALSRTGAVPQWTPPGKVVQPVTVDEVD